MKLLHSRKSQNLLLIFLGVIGLTCFFVLYPTVHPHNVIDLEYSREEIYAKTDSILFSWNIQISDYKKVTTLHVDENVLDSLQRKWGKKNFQQNLKNSNNASDILVYWNTEAYLVKEGEIDISLNMTLNPKGEIITFDASNEFISSQKPVNRQAIRYVLNQRDYDLSKSFEDSLVKGLLDYQHLDDVEENDTRAMQIIEKLRSLRGNETSEMYTNNNIWQLTDYYIQRTVWKDFELSADSVEMKEDNNFQFARAYFSGELPEEGLTISLIVDVLPAGSLKGIKAEVQPEKSPTVDNGDIGEIIGFLIFALFFLWLFVIFYLRIKAKAIDTKPAIIVAVLTGFIAPAYLALFMINEASIYTVSYSYSEIIGLLISMSIFGALSAVTFFILTAVSDSITRQYWPEKLKTWDLIRRGIFKNKPVGWVIIHGFAIGSIFVGILSVLLVFIPDMRIDTNLSLISDTYFLAPLANLLFSFFIVLLIVIIVYLIIGNHIVGMTKMKWLIPIISSIFFGVLTVAPVDVSPWSYNLAVNLILGFALGLFYLRYDFLTTIFAAFTFVNLVLTEEGFLIGNSPDAGVFYFFISLILSLLFVATYLVIKGTDREELPEYVPSYIEEQALEQRLKQELAIARVVQKTFLPSKIKRLPGIDIAGTCIPALETGGDYYDMISLGEARTAITIGDVSGKGIRAAFYMTFVKGVLHSLSPLILSPVELMNQLNRLFIENATRGTFISMIYGILEADKRQFTFARAGHNPMLVVRKNGKSEWLQPKGVGIGVAKGESFLRGIEESVLRIKEGDVIILYTDGITEMLDSGKRFYGEERLEKLVKEIRTETSSEILETIINNVNAFKGLEKQHDDMTLVVIKADNSIAV